jgi:hypothetical protein
VPQKLMCDVQVCVCVCVLVCVLLCVLSCLCTEGELLGLLFHLGVFLLCLGCTLDIAPQRYHLIPCVLHGRCPMCWTLSAIEPHPHPTARSS